jgi:prolyl oligopeptidase
MRTPTLALAALGLTFFACAPAEAPQVPAQAPTAAPPAAKVSKYGYPDTAKRPVKATFHGVEVTDDYQWLEASKDPEVAKWVEAQNGATRGYLDAIPFRKVVRDKVEGIVKALSADYYALEWSGGRLFAIKSQPPAQQDFLVVMKSADAPETAKVLVDPNAIDPKGATTIDAYYPSADGKKVAVSMSVGGTESGTVHVFDVETGKETGDLVPAAHSGTAGGSLAWKKDGTGFYYTRHPHVGERPAEDLGFYQQVYFHKLGTKDSEDVYLMGKDLPKIAEIELEASPDGKWMHVSVQNGDGGEYWHFFVDQKGTVTRFADIPDKVVHASFGPDGKAYLLSLKDAPKGKILRVDPAKPDLAKAAVVVPASEPVIQGYVVGKTRLYVKDLLGGPSQVRVFDLSGKEKAKLPIPPISSVRQMLHLEGDDVLFRGVSYTDPPAWLTYAAKDDKTHTTKLATTSPVSFADVEAVRETCTSKDGTKVPINILRKKGTKLDGSNPTLLMGYGGYGISLAPGFDPTRRIWLDQGGVYAVANLRGGGEFGEDWHLQGNLTKKQNVFDDFYACSKYLVDSGHTKPERLAILGGSNGGLLMGAALTQHPEMYRAVVSFVGIYDMLRVELTPNGQFNTTEFGTVKDPDHFKALYAYSPLHNVKDGVTYPAVLMPTGANDPRVDPFQSRKFVARLQAASPDAGPFFVRESSLKGHGAGTPLSEEIEESTDMFTFLFQSLGITPK